MKNLHDCFQRKKQITVSTKNKKRNAGVSDSEVKCGIFLCCTADMESGRRLEKEATAAEIRMRAIIKMKLGDCLIFCNFGKAGMYQHSQSEGATWHRR